MPHLGPDGLTIDEAIPPLFRANEFYYTEASQSSIRLAKIEKEVSTILENQLQLVECASRMDWALSLLVKCLPEMLQGLTEMNWRDKFTYDEWRQRKVGSTNIEHVGEASLNAPQMMERERNEDSMPREMQNQMVDASALSDILHQMMQEFKIEMRTWCERGVNLEAHATGKYAESAGTRAGIRVSLKGNIDLSGFDTTKWTQVELDCLQAVIDNRKDKVIKLLSEGLDANAEMKDVKLGRKVLNHCSFLAPAIHAGNSSMVELLVDKRAQVDAMFGFIAGSSEIEWSGPVSFMAVAKGDLEILNLLVKLRADPHAVSSQNANMVWQAAYYGHAHVLGYLLDLDVDIERKAWSQDRYGVSYSPLHIAIIAGQKMCVNTLLDAKAKINYMNQEGCTPLEDAIRSHRPGIVCSLVSEGAELVREMLIRTDTQNSQLPEFESFKSKPFYSKFSGCCAIKYSSSMLQALFDSRSPILLRAAAIGLQGQPDQVALMSLEDVTAFFEVPGAPKVEMLRALFCRRRLLYRGSNQETLYLKMAALGGRAFPHVVLSKHSFLEIEAAFEERQACHPSVQAFLDKLVPQSAPPARIFFLDTASHARIFRVRKFVVPVIVPVETYECLVPGLENDFRVIRALSDCHRFDKIWEELQCQVIFKIGWKRTRWMAELEAFVHAMLMIVFWILAFLSMEKNGQSTIFGLSHHSSIQCAAFIGIPFWLCEVCKEFFELLAYISEGLLVEYISSIANFLDVTRILVDGLLLLQFCAGDNDTHDQFELRIWFAACCFLKWTKSVYCLSSFRTFGFQVLPILFALNDIGPFVVIMLFYLAGISHAFCATDFLKDHASVTILNSFYFGMLADGSRLGRVYYVNKDGVELSNQQWFKGALVLLIAFALPITLMNIFIAALSTSYQDGINSKETLFQHRRAQSVLSQTAIKRILSRINCKQRSNKEQLRMWYCGMKRPT